MFLSINLLSFQAVSQANKLKMELDLARGTGPFIHCLQRLQRASELENLPLPALKQIQAQLRLDLDSLEKVSVSDERYSFLKVYLG